MGTCSDVERKKIRRNNTKNSRTNSTINQSNFTQSNKTESKIEQSKNNESNLNRSKTTKSKNNEIKSKINQSKINESNITKSKINKSKINVSNIENKSQTFRTLNSEQIVKTNSFITNETLFLLDIEDNVPFPPGENYYKLVNNSNMSSIINKSDNLSEKVELFFSLNNIQNSKNRYSFDISIINNKRIGILDYLGKLNERTGKHIEFSESFIVDYFFERQQIVIIEPLINGEKTGEKMEFVLCNLMTIRECKKNIKINNIGTLEISYRKIINEEELNSEISCFQFYITLDNDIFKNPKNLENIFYVIRNIKDGKKRRPVYKSHEYNFELNKEKQTSWISLDSQLLCSNYDRQIFFELYCPSLKRKEYIGCNSFTLNKLKSNLEKDINEIIEIKSQEYGKLGVLKIFYNNTKKIRIEEFVKKGNINLEIAIDYTSSNGKPDDKESLHYKYGTTPNDYEKAIKSCGDIIANYDSDQLFPVYGFGGKPNGKDKVSHCFNINFNEDDGNIIKIENIIKFYKESLDKVELSGPTYFAPVIKKVISNINHDLENKKFENHYYILMILTDGIIIDMKETIDYIVEGSKLPLSIVIIGIGDADFTNMEKSDGDKIPLVNSFGEIRKRDIVQFVEFNKFKDEKGVKNGDELAEEVLKEIPRQIEDYYHFCGKFYE